MSLVSVAEEPVEAAGGASSIATNTSSNSSATKPTNSCKSAAFGINMLLLLAAGWALAYGGVFFLGFGALTDQVALELAEGAEYVEDEPPA